jgi:hypothetical protein
LTNFVLAVIIQTVKFFGLEMDPKKFSTQTVLELACAAYRFYDNRYIKDDLSLINPTDPNGPIFPNKDLMLIAVGINRYQSVNGIGSIPLISTNLEDKDLAEQIRKWYKKAIFTAVTGENDFLTNVFSILNHEEVAQNQFGYVACLPHVYKRDIKKSNIKKLLDQAEDAQLGIIDQTLVDLDVEILDVKKSENYDAYNVLAIIDNKIASWMSNKEVKEGPAVLVKGKIKAIQKSFRTDKVETRLNYVKVAQ